MSKLFLESLDSNRLVVLKKLTDFKHLGVLGGGTALSLQIGHRGSYDFDIFIEEKLGSKIWQKAKDVFGKNSIKLLDVEDQLDLTTPEGIKVTLFHDDYKLLFKPTENEFVNLMDIKDIAAYKAFIQGRRPKWRDYVDLYFIIKKNYLTLEKIIELALKKFGNDFSEKLFLEQLVYWDDINNYEIEFINKNIAPGEIKLFLENEVKTFKKKSFSQSL